MNDVTIPVSAYAIVASVAAEHYNESLPDLFDCFCPSRARFMALSIMRQIYPKASLAEMARCLGFQGGGKEIASIYKRGVNCKWFDEFALHLLTKECCEKLKLEHVYEKETGDELPVMTVSQEQVASQFVPRKVRPARVVLARAARPANVTGALMGDPGFSSRRVAANEISRGLT